MAFLIIILSAVRVPVLVCVNDLQFLKLGVKENLHPACISLEVGRHFYLCMEIAVCQIAVEGKKKKEEEGDPRNWADQENAFFLERSTSINFVAIGQQFVEHVEATQGSMCNASVVPSHII